MAGEWRGFHRLRHGNLRIVFTIDAGNRTVVIANIRPRGDAYK
jgi:mRNA interferase RelE/StbE